MIKLVSWYDLKSLDFGRKQEPPEENPLRHGKDMHTLQRIAVVGSQVWTENFLAVE